MNASTPIQIDGKTYDRYSLNLIVSGSYTLEGQPEASIVCDLIPTRIKNDNIEKAPQSAINIRLGMLDQADAPALAAVTAIYATLQTYITEKGL